MSNVKTAISILWFLFTVVIGSYYFVLTNDVQNLEKELAQINCRLQPVPDVQPARRRSARQSF